MTTEIKVGELVEILYYGHPVGVVGKYQKCVHEVVKVSRKKIQTVSLDGKKGSAYHHEDDGAVTYRKAKTEAQMMREWRACGAI